jgi:hypothetical protein
MPQDKLPQLLGSFRFMVLPCVRDSEGDMDGLPQVLMEAMACGRPVISTKLVGIPDLIRHEMDGLLVTTGNVPELVDAIERMLTDDAMVDRMGESSAEYVRQYFDRNSNVDRVAALFQWALETPGHSAPPCKLLWPAAPGAYTAYPPERVLKKVIHFRWHFHRSTKLENYWKQNVLKVLHQR